jgi:hypothetical protein
MLIAPQVDLSRMAGGRSTARAGWAAIVGVAIGAALLAGAREPAPAVSATLAQPPSIVHVTACTDDPRDCYDRRVTAR